MKSFNEIFGKIVPSDVNEQLKNCVITKCEVDTDSRSLNLALILEQEVEETIINSLKRSCIAALKLNSIDVDITVKRQEVEPEIVEKKGGNDG